MGMGVALGVAVGVAIGLAMGNVAIGISIGVAVGMALGMTGETKPGAGDAPPPADDVSGAERFGNRPHTRWRRL